MYSYSYSDKYIKLDYKQKDIGLYQCKHLYKVLKGYFTIMDIWECEKKIESMAQGAKIGPFCISVISRYEQLH